MDELRGSAIIPSWNTRDLLADCLDTVAGQRLAGGLETIVVDDGSTDGTDALLRARADQVRTIENEDSVGFGAACNQGAREARGRVLFFLNSDTRLLEPDTLERLARAVEAPGVGIAGPLILNPDGSLQPSCAAHPSVSRALLLALGLQRLLPDRLRARASPDTWSHDRSRDTGWLKGAALAVPAALFREVGGFWEAPYGEEQDLAYRIARRGLRVRFEPSARIVHVGNSSFGQLWSSSARAERVASAELLFLRTHYGHARGAAIRAITGTAYAARAPVHRLLGHSDQAGVYRALARTYARRPRAGAHR